MSEQLPLQGSQQQQRILVNNQQIHDIQSITGFQDIYNQQIQQQRHPTGAYYQHPRQLAAYQQQGKQISNVLLQAPHANNNNSNGNDKYLNYNNNMGCLNSGSYPPAYPQPPLQLSGQGYSVSNPASIHHMAHQQSQSQVTTGQQKYQSQQQQIQQQQQLQQQQQQQQQQQNSMNASHNPANNAMSSMNYQKKNETQLSLDQQQQQQQQQQPQYSHLMKDTASCKQNYSCEICKANVCELCSDHNSTHMIVSLERLFEYSFKNQFESQQKDYLSSLFIAKTVEQSLQMFASKIKQLVDDSFVNYRIFEMLSKHEWAAAGNLFRSNYTNNSNNSSNSSSNNNNNSMISHGSTNNDGNALFVRKGEGKTQSDFEKEFDIENKKSQDFLGSIKQMIASNVVSAVSPEPFINNPLILSGKQNSNSNTQQSTSNQPQKQLGHLFEPQNFQIQLGLKQNQQNNSKQSAIPGGARTQPPRNGSSSSQNATSIQNLGSSGNIVEQSSTHTNINNSSNPTQPIQYFLLQGNKPLQSSNNNSQMSQQGQASQQQQQSSTSLQLLSSSQQFQQQQQQSSSQNNCNTSNINNSNLNVGYQQSSSSKQSQQQQQVTQSQQPQQPNIQRRPVHILQQNGQNGFIKTTSNTNNNNSSFQLNNVGSIMNNINPSNEGKLSNTSIYDNNITSTNAQASNNNSMDQQDGSLIIIDQGPTKKQQLNNSNTNPFASSLNLSNNNSNTNNSGTILKTREEIYNNFIGAKSLNSNNSETRSFIITDTPKTPSQAHHSSHTLNHHHQHQHHHHHNSSGTAHSNNLLDESTLQNQLQLKTHLKKRRFPKEFKDKVTAEYNANKKTIKELSQHFGIAEGTISFWIKEEKKSREKREKDGAVHIGSNGSINALNNALSQQSLSGVEYTIGSKNGTYYSPQVVEKGSQGLRANYNKKISELQSSSSFRKHSLNSNKSIYQQQHLLAQSRQALNGNNGISLEEEVEEEDDRQIVKKEYGTSGGGILGMEEEDSPIDEGIADRTQQDKKGIGHSIKNEEYGFQDNYESDGENYQSDNNEEDKMEEDYHESLDSNGSNNGSNSITNENDTVKDTENLKDDSQAIIQPESALILENNGPTEKTVIATNFEQTSVEFKTEYVDSNQFTQNCEQPEQQRVDELTKVQVHEETAAFSSSQQEQNCIHKEQEDGNDVFHQVIKEKPVISVNEIEPPVGNQLQQEEQLAEAASLAIQNNVQMKLVCFPLMDNSNSYYQYTVGCSILAQSDCDTVCVKGFQNEEWNVLNKYKFNSYVVELKYVQAKHIQRTYLIVQLKNGELYSWNWQDFREGQQRSTSSDSQICLIESGHAQPFLLSENTARFDAFYFKQQIIVAVQYLDQTVTFSALQLRVNTISNSSDNTENENINNNINKLNNLDKHQQVNLNHNTNSKLQLGVKKQSKRKDSLSDESEDEENSEESEEQDLKQSQQQTDKTQNSLTNDSSNQQQQEQLIKLESLTTALPVSNTTINNLIAWGQEATSCIYLCMNSGNLFTSFCAQLDANELIPNRSLNNSAASPSTTSSLKPLYSVISEDTLTILKLRLHKNTSTQQEVIGASETGFLYMFDLVKLHQQYFKTKFQRGESMRDMQVFNSNEEKSEEVRVILCYDDFLRIRRHKKLQFQQGMRCATLSLSEQEITVYYILNQHDTIMKHTISLQP